MPEVASPIDEIRADLLIRCFIPNYRSATPVEVQKELKLDEPILSKLEERSRELLSKRK